MKRFVSVFILAAVLLASFASCGTKEEADTAARTDEMTAQITETESAEQTGEVTETAFF